MYICIPVLIYTHTHTYILVTWAFRPPESQRAKKQSFWVWCLGSITEGSVHGFSVVPDPVEGDLGHPAEQTQRCISRTSSRITLCPWPLCATVAAGLVQEAGLVLPEGPQSLPWGKATPRCSQGHGAPGTASTPAWCPFPAMGTVEKGPAAASFRGTPGDGLLCVLW